MNAAGRIDLLLCHLAGVDAGSPQFGDWPRQVNVTAEENFIFGNAAYLRAGVRRHKRGRNGNGDERSLLKAHGVSCWLYGLAC